MLLMQGYETLSEVRMLISFFKKSVIVLKKLIIFPILKLCIAHSQLLLLAK